MRPADADFDRSVSPNVEVRRLASGHLFVKPQINGTDVGWFALDTGSGVGMAIVSVVIVGRPT